MSCLQLTTKTNLNFSVQTSVHLFTARATWMKIKERKVQKNRNE